MKKLVLVGILMGISQYLYSQPMTYLTCKNDDITISYHGPSAITQDIPYKLKLNTETVEHDGVPFEEDIASESDSHNISFKFKIISTSITPILKPDNDSTKEYQQTIEFIGFPILASKELKEVMNSKQTLNCTETVSGIE